MTKSQAALLLSLASSFDARTIGRSDAEAWAIALAGLDYERCRAAIVKHYSDSTDRIMPAHIRRMARTTTDITRGETSTQTVDDAGNVLCGDCKLMHRPDEPCSVLIADDGMWRKALGMFRRPAELEPAPER